LRDRIIWEKSNVMPESVTDRCSRSYEFVFFFVKEPKNYFYEQQHEPYETPPKELARYLEFDYEGQATKDYESALAQNPSDTKRRIIEGIRAKATAIGKFGGNKAEGYGNPTYSGKPWIPQELLGRNMRNVWKIATESYEGQHFAPYPQELCRRCIVSGCPEFICNNCGHVRTMEYDDIEIEEETRPGLDTGNGKSGGPEEEDPNASLHNSELSKKKKKKRPIVIHIPKGLSDCGCDVGWHAGTVLDPFMGSGTTCLVAMKLGRDSVGIELNKQYIDDAFLFRLGEIDFEQDRLF
jgi:site-specific DNA-methyltransferase (adenine-specific)